MESWNSRSLILTLLPMFILDTSYSMEAGMSSELTTQSTKGLTGYRYPFLFSAGHASWPMMETGTLTLTACPGGHRCRETLRHWEVTGWKEKDRMIAWQTLSPSRSPSVSVHPRKWSPAPSGTTKRISLDFAYSLVCLRRSLSISASFSDRWIVPTPCVSLIGMRTAGTRPCARNLFTSYLLVVPLGTASSLHTSISGLPTLALSRPRPWTFFLSCANLLFCLDSESWPCSSGLAEAAHVLAWWTWCGCRLRKPRRTPASPTTEAKGPKSPPLKTRPPPAWQALKPPIEIIIP
mmetsp:Transcript_7219/g.24807  ORF Transcript_7219/g.24807 Transcript_7219/m.24807 type:complete len:293 (+) Transcript_7219:140-1018(+)